MAAQSLNTSESFVFCNAMMNWLVEDQESQVFKLWKIRTLSACVTCKGKVIIQKDWEGSESQKIMSIGFPLLHFSEIIGGCG